MRYPGLFFVQKSGVLDRWFFLDIRKFYFVKLFRASLASIVLREKIKRILSNENHHCELGIFVNHTDGKCIPYGIVLHNDYAVLAGLLGPGVVCSAGSSEYVVRSNLLHYFFHKWVDGTRLGSSCGFKKSKTYGGPCVRMLGDYLFFMWGS